MRSIWCNRCGHMIHADKFADVSQTEWDKEAASFRRQHRRCSNLKNNIVEQDDEKGAAK